MSLNSASARTRHRGPSSRPFRSVSRGSVRSTWSGFSRSAFVASAMMLATAPKRWSLRRQAAIGLLAYAVMFVVLVATGIDGSSSGVLYGVFHAGTDPNLIAGSPRPVRSDEWLVVTPLIVSQVQNGFTQISHVFPGGMDASILWDLPYVGWSVLFRPHLLGFFFLPLNSAFAFKWWFPFFALAGAAYVLLVVMWRRPLAAFATAGIFAVSPFMQWWFLPNTFWPPAAALAACAAVLLLLGHPRGWWRWLVAAAAAYLVVVSVITLYPPFLVPCIVAAAGFAVGAVFSKRELGWRELARRLIPLVVGAAGSVVVTAVFLVQHTDTVKKVLSTVYPGERLTPTGHGVPWYSVYAGVFGAGLRAGDLSQFAANPSEGSSFLFLGFFLAPVALWLLVRQVSRRRVDWLLLGTLVSLGALVAFIYVPGWDALSHLLLLDRTTANRSIIGVGLSSVLVLAVVVRELDRAERRAPWWITGPVAVLVLCEQIAVRNYLRESAPGVLAVVPLWPVMVGLLAIAVLLFARRHVTAAAVTAGVVSLMVAGWVNPLYRGVLDLRATDAGRAIERVQRAEPGAWLGLGGARVAAILRETGVEAYSGVQPYPSEEMWSEIDPDKSSEAAWNRYAHVNWTLSPDAQEAVNPQADVVVARLDTCSAFAQKYVDHVFTEQTVDQPCVRLVESIPANGTAFFIYDVVAP